ncbi:hypothetical protein BJX65DRAFT_272918 [Aspergillus insuetus]
MKAFKKLAAKLRHRKNEKKLSKPTESKQDTSTEFRGTKPAGRKTEPHPTRSEKQDSTKPKGSPWTVTDEERYRYQKTVLGMTDAQIAQQLKPGHYEFQGTSMSDRPSGEGHLAYRYGYRYKQTAC